MLEKNYYQEAIDELKLKILNPIFIFLSDDTEYVENEFSHIKNKIVTKNNFDVDLAVMSLCQNGIMSASSYSWWGGYFSRERHKNLIEKKQIFIAPEYWMGRRNKSWYPLNMRFDWLTYI